MDQIGEPANQPRSEAERCEFKAHCDGQGRIQVYLPHFDVYACVQCVAVEENVTVDEVCEDARGNNPDIWVATQREAG